MVTIGKKNKYICATCKRRIITIDIDIGVTPFSIPCGYENCDGVMYSSFYKLGLMDHRLPVMHEWFKPNEKQLKQLTLEQSKELPNIPTIVLLEHNQEHLAQGGLFLRKKL